MGCTTPRRFRFGRAGPELISKFRRIAADELDALTNSLTGTTHEVEFFFSQLAVHRTTADEPALFVLKNNDFKRVSRHNVVLAKRLCNFDGAHRSHHAVVVSTFGDSIDMRADQERAFAWIAALQSHIHIACDVGRNLKTGLARRVRHQIMRTRIIVRVAASRVVGAELTLERDRPG